MKEWLLMIFAICALFLFVPCQQRRNGDEDDNFPNNDFIKFVNDVQRNLGLDEEAFSKFGKYISKLVQEGQAYTAKEFERDLNKVKRNPTFWNIFDLVKKTTWSGVVYCCIEVVHFFSHIQQFLLRFLERKCDKHIGKENVFHPWNIVKEQDKTNISFLIFVYVISLSFILIKILSWWNFAIYLAVGFLIYYVGGPYLVYKWLLTLTAFIWFVFDVIIHNPLQIALLLIAVYLLNLMKQFVTSNRRSRSNHVPPSREGHRSFSRVLDEERRSVSDGPDREEFSSLVERIESMETKTNLLYNKLDMLSRTIERVVPDDVL